jgi:hypothetical protein
MSSSPSTVCEEMEDEIPFSRSVPRHLSFSNLLATPGLSPMGPLAESGSLLSGGCSGIITNINLEVDKMSNDSSRALESGSSSTELSSLPNTSNQTLVSAALANDDYCSMSETESSFQWCFVLPGDPCQDDIAIVLDSDNISEILGTTCVLGSQVDSKLNSSSSSTRPLILLKCTNM